MNRKGRWKTQKNQGGRREFRGQREKRKEERFF